jgi:hypothetical protein
MDVLLTRRGFECCTQCYEQRHVRGIDTQCENCPETTCSQYLRRQLKDKNDEDPLGW